MKKLLIMMVALVLVFSLAACGSQSATTPPADAGDGPIVVGIINQDPSESGYRAANVADFDRVFTAANGYEAKTFYSKVNDEQLNAARGFITDGVDYLLISAAATDGWEPVLTEAKDNGVKVLLFDRMLNADESLYEGAVVSDMAQEGITAVTWLKEQNLPVYNVLHLQGAMGSDAQIGRTAALDAEFAAGTMNKVLQQAAGEWDEGIAKTIVAAAINDGLEFNVVYAENDGMARGAVAALDEAGITHGRDGDVVIMGFDTNVWALEALLNGEWNFDMQCSPFQADVIHGMIGTLESGGTISPKKIISEEKGFDTNTITQADVDQYGI